MATLPEIEAQLTGPGAPFETTTEDVLGERMTVYKQRARSLRELVEASRAHGDNECVVHEDRRITFGEHADLVASVAHALRDEYGIEPGDRVGILAANCPEWLITFWATTSIGGVVTALNGWWQQDEILFALEDSQPKLLLGDRKRLDRLDGCDVGIPVLEFESDFAGLERHAPGKPFPEVPIEEDAPAVILYTSGTTGRPKGAVSSHRGVCGFVNVGVLNGVRNMMFASSQGVTAEPSPPMCTLITAPLFHMSGLYAGAVTSLATGGKTVWRSGRFDPGDVLRLIDAERVTSWSALGNTSYLVVTHPDVEKYDLSSIRNIGSGGAPTSKEVQEALRKVFPTGAHNVGLGYGLSESVTPCSMIGGLELKEFPNSVGRIAPTHEVEIRDDAGNAVGEGVEGEIYIRSPYLMLEYWNRPDVTAETLLPGRWLRTGDVGRIEGERLFINSRARDLILRGAENVYPVEIEHRLEAHADVAEAAVAGVQHPSLGQEVKAFVVPSRGATLDTDVLAAWVGDTLAPFKVPTLWDIRSELLPRNASGKVMKHVLLGEADNTFVEE